MYLFTATGNAIVLSSSIVYALLIQAPLLDDGVTFHARKGLLYDYYSSQI